MAIQILVSNREEALAIIARMPVKKGSWTYSTVARYSPSPEKTSSAVANTDCKNDLHISTFGYHNSAFQYPSGVLEFIIIDSGPMSTVLPSITTLVESESKFGASLKALKSESHGEPDLHDNAIITTKLVKKLGHDVVSPTFLHAEHAHTVRHPALKKNIELFWNKSPVGSRKPAIAHPSSLHGDYTITEHPVKSDFSAMIKTVELLSRNCFADARKATVRHTAFVDSLLSSDGSRKSGCDHRSSASTLEGSSFKVTAKPKGECPARKRLAPYYTNVPLNAEVHDAELYKRLKTKLWLEDTFPDPLTHIQESSTVISPPEGPTEDDIEVGFYIHVKTDNKTTWVPIEGKNASCVEEDMVLNDSFEMDDSLHFDLSLFVHRDVVWRR
ncbi:hypothetical protein B0J11DRAFT_564600 [Dendryphion nanum]|uniref:Uncharacterized protein n=1 Tax=Dendryphion nanum TaxID=256645 RepID=A0A9P9EDL9_9PLEO|nr:hypothetical protein B0J11DRAFT_564600 [Dendryphion nanum]